MSSAAQFDDTTADGGAALEDAPSSAAVLDAEPVIRLQIQPGAKQCYELGLESNPTQAGRLVILIKIGPTGEVDTATVGSNSGLSAAVASCVAAVAQGAKFPAPGSAGARIAIPVVFKRQVRDGGALARREGSVPRIAADADWRR